MKKLELGALGVEEITNNELEQTNGGFAFFVELAAAAVADIIYDWDNFERGLSGRAYKAK